MGKAFRFWFFLQLIYLINFVAYARDCSYLTTLAPSVRAIRLEGAVAVTNNRLNRSLLLAAQEVVGPDGELLLTNFPRGGFHTRDEIRRNLAAFPERLVQSSDLMRALGGIVVRNVELFEQGLSRAAENSKLIDQNEMMPGGTRPGLRFVLQHTSLNLEVRKQIQALDRFFVMIFGGPDEPLYRVFAFDPFVVAYVYYYFVDPSPFPGRERILQAVRAGIESAIKKANDVNPADLVQLEPVRGRLLRRAESYFSNFQRYIDAKGGRLLFDAWRVISGE